MKIQYSALVSATSGKLNGSVASHNKGGAYLRNKGLVTNPQTVSQQSNRMRFGSLSQLWRGLTPSQRQTWTEMAPSYPYQDKLQQTRILSGSQLFVKLNQVLLSYTGTYNTVAPSPMQLPAIYASEFEVNRDLTPATPGQDMVFNTLAVGYNFSGTVNNNYSVIIMASPGISPGISNAKTRMRTLAGWTNLPNDGSGLLELDVVVNPLYNAMFGPQEVGSKIFIEMFVVNNETGQASIKVSASAIVGSIS